MELKSTKANRVDRRRLRARRGAAAVEFALTAGLAFLFFWGAFEFSRVAMIRGTVDNAIYEGARVGIIPGATSADVRDKVREILGYSMIRSAEIEVSPKSLQFDSKTVGVKVNLLLDKNAFSPGLFFSGKSIVRSIQMKREASRFVAGK